VDNHPSRECNYSAGNQEDNEAARHDSFVEEEVVEKFLKRLVSRAGDRFETAKDDTSNAAIYGSKDGIKVYLTGPLHLA
jgi:hypothetical protein